ncbi:MAG: protein phosphatase 2C domain-containing protein [Candidatus Scalindua sp.]|nr:protein phosphatase 2C domain-containing protein [Candidatus Scalindua sp.]
MRTIHKSIAGKNKPENQDSFLVDEKEGIFIIADGMSGWNGRNASTTAIHSIFKSLPLLLNSRMKSDAMSAALKISLKEADKEVTSLQERSGTTIDIGIIRDEVFHLAHIGDSRVYLLYENLNFEQVTNDMARPQSLYHGREPQDEIEKKILSLTKSYMPSNWIGDHDSGHEKLFQFESIPLLDVRRILMTTDGLTDLTLDNEIREALLTRNLQDASDKLESYIGYPNKISETFITHLEFFLENHLKEQSILSMLDPIFNQFSNNANMRKMREHYKNSLITDERHREFILGYFKKFPETKDCFLGYLNNLLSFSDDTTFIIIEPNGENFRQSLK